jgi:hypothetical protein
VPLIGTLGGGGLRDHFGVRTRHCAPVCPVTETCSPAGWRHGTPSATPQVHGLCHGSCPVNRFQWWSEPAKSAPTGSARLPERCSLRDYPPPIDELSSVDGGRRAPDRTLCAGRPASPRGDAGSGPRKPSRILPVAWSGVFIRLPTAGPTAVRRRVLLPATLSRRAFSRRPPCWWLRLAAARRPQGSGRRVGFR